MRKGTGRMTTARGPKPVVALVGRPNVGKSTLFNRLIGQRKAIVAEVPGTTRDRLYGTARWGDREFLVVDTAGLIPEDEVTPGTPQPEIARRAREQAELALAEADVIVFVVDAAEGITAHDRELARILRRSSAPVLVAANKADNEERRLNAYEFYELGFPQVFPLSAYHGTGTGDLLDAVVEALPPRPEGAPEEAWAQIALLGRPNVGKSTFLNAVLGEERSAVSPVPGTTRDPIDTELFWEGKRVRLVDTAGIRRRGRIQRGLERYSVLRALRALSRADVAILLIDAEEGPTDQDAHLAEMAVREGVGLVLAVNKWDRVPAGDPRFFKEFQDRMAYAFRFVPYAPVHYIVALRGKNVGKVMSEALRVAEERRKRVATAALNRWLQEAVAAHRPPVTRSGKPQRFFYVAQVGEPPPTFVFFVRDRERIHFSYARYLENRLREAFGFRGVPVRFVFRDRSEA